MTNWILTFAMLGFIFTAFGLSVWGIALWRLFQEWREHRRILKRRPYVVKGYPLHFKKDDEKAA